MGELIKCPPMSHGFDCSLTTDGVQLADYEYFLVTCYKTKLFEYGAKSTPQSSLTDAHKAQRLEP